MIVRKLDFGTDAQELIRGGLAFIQHVIQKSPESAGCFSTDPEDLRRTLAHLNNIGALHGVVSEEDNKLTAGCLFCTLSPIWNSKVTIAEELCWWAHPGANPRAAYKVLQGALQFMKELGTKYQLFSVMDVSDTRVIKAYERLGLKYSQTNYIGVS